MRLGIIANTDKPRVREIVPDFINWLTQEKIEFVVSDDLIKSGIIEAQNALPSEGMADGVDFILSFGGDGTFLQTARLVAQNGKPIIGVNLGGFGYLAEVQVDQLQQRINELFDGNYDIQERMMLQAFIGEDHQPITGLNDVVVDKSCYTRAIRLDISIDGEYLNTFFADGVIVATPTGSTGYSLSAGGPILEPEVDCFIVIPISPHMLAHRPIVVRSNRIVQITAESELGHVMVAADGQESMLLTSGKPLTIQVAPFKTKIVTFKDHSFYKLLRNKLQWRFRV